MTRLLHVQLCAEQRETTFVFVSLSTTSCLASSASSLCLSSSSASSHLILPPLRLFATPATTSVSDVATSSFLHALATAPFWLDIALSYLDPHDWLLLESLSHALGHHIKYTEAWGDVDLGPAFLPFLPLSLAPPQIIQRIRREVIERQVSLRRMHKAWAGLKKFAAPGVVWTLNSGLEEGVVRRLETKMGCVLPPDLRASFLIHDGQGFLANPGMMVGGGRLLSLSEVVLESGKEGGEETEGVPRLLASPALRLGEEGVEGGRARMVPVSEGARGRSVCVALPKRRRRAGEEGGEGKEEGEMEGLGCIYMVTALSCRRLASSWGEYMGSLR